MIPQEAAEAAEARIRSMLLRVESGGDALGIAVAAVEAAAPFLRAQALAEVAPLIHSLTDRDYCSFDHHGGCQAHGYLDLQPGETCPQQEAKEFVKAHGVKDDDASKD
ncbi:MULTISPECIES: hypothetical protein [Arthrobacter]|uniref:Uncharacterized protein n=1 Tax=Arthrobacter terricola TaxID=2547396 RepID=A0A4R5KMP1_9MICC|nr:MULTISPECIES: hypothetical protein [Arthrobacter]MBT8161017.1 hypothetical protein [Arthrobacter sp. GN70]TDF96881.1 hypothetical protein E1809_09160 [Arthrobacter terricola]